MPNQHTPAAESKLHYSATPATDLTEFSEKDRLLIVKVEQAIQEGVQLERWYREQESRLLFFPLDLKNSYRLPNRAEGFFGNLSISGQSRTIMGCRQEVQFGQFSDANLAERLQEFVLKEFQTRSHWTYEDGAPGGFTFEKTIYRDAANGYQRFPAGDQDGPVDWTTLGRRYAWVLLTVHIHDFVVKMGPWKKRLREAAYVVPHPDFLHVIRNPSKDCALEVSIGYPFVDVAPHANIFGFGPGKFGAAVKLFSFFLSPQNDLHVRMVFAAAPRAQKVLDLGKRIPDPVYGGAELLRYLSLGLLNPQVIHARMDAHMLVLHCQVHQALMDGVQKVWRDWLQTNS
ncbi:MAG: hypothetical protein HY316_06830 [Acidobacteria bacterium]|nr:hypothetical protein [Acidobacteriota bacterium]